MNLSLRPFFILVAMSAWLALPEAQAQRNRRGTSKELGVQLGTAWYVGDLNPGNMFRSVSHVTRGAFYRHNLNTRWSFGGSTSKAESKLGMPTTRMVGSKTETCTSGTKSTSTPSPRS